MQGRLALMVAVSLGIMFAGSAMLVYTIQIMFFDYADMTLSMLSSVAIVFLLSVIIVKLYERIKGVNKNDSEEI